MTFPREKLGAKERRAFSKTMTWILSLKEDVRELYALSESDLIVRILVKDLYGMRRNGESEEVMSSHTCLMISATYRRGSTLNLLNCEKKAKPCLRNR